MACIVSCQMPESRVVDDFCSNIHTTAIEVSKISVSRSLSFECVQTFQQISSTNFPQACFANNPLSSPDSSCRMDNRSSPKMIDPSGGVSSCLYMMLFLDAPNDSVKRGGLHLALIQRFVKVNDSLRALISPLCQPQDCLKWTKASTMYLFCGST